MSHNAVAVGLRCIAEGVKIALQHQWLLAFHSNLKLLLFLPFLGLLVEVEADAGDEQGDNSAHDEGCLQSASSLLRLFVSGLVAMGTGSWL